MTAKVKEANAPELKEHLTKLSDISVSTGDLQEELINLIESNFKNQQYVLIPENKTLDGLITKPIIEMEIKKDFPRLVIKKVTAMYIVSNQWNDVEAKQEFIVDTTDLSENKLFMTCQMFWRKLTYTGVEGVRITFFY